MYREAGVLIRLEGLVLNPPVIKPGKILAVGSNYAAHAEEQNKEAPGSPLDILEMRDRPDRAGGFDHPASDFGEGGL